MVRIVGIAVANVASFARTNLAYVSFGMRAQR